MTIYFIDGQFTEKDSLNISIDDRGYYFGDGVYEVVKVYDGELYTAEQHFERLFQSASKVKMSVPYSEQQLIDIAKELVKVNDVKTGHIYMQVTRGASPRIHQFPELAVTPVVTGYAVHNPRPMSNLENGVAVKIVDDIRWLRCDIKSLNLISECPCETGSIRVRVCGGDTRSGWNCDGRLILQCIWYQGWGCHNTSGNESHLEWDHPPSRIEAL